MGLVGERMNEIIWNNGKLKLTGTGFLSTKLTTNPVNSQNNKQDAYPIPCEKWNQINQTQELKHNHFSGKPVISAYLKKKNIKPI
jgi:hypothetical protein